MSGYVGILVSDPWLQNQFTQVELRSLKTHVLFVYVYMFGSNLVISVFFDLISVFYLKFMSMRRESGKLTLRDLASRMSRLKVVGENLTEEDRAACIQDLYQNLDEEVDFEFFLKVCLFISISTSFMRIRAEIRE
jgi:plastin-1